ncbi:MAG TPA: sigma-70 family RNA polymerase sigma factor, partial [Armatimonadota bacterium]|nr:sigma-70 family RNA polymerase sigma factor [Armatimonadota bacterium]
MEDVREFARRAMAGDMDAFANLVTRFEDMAVGYAYAKLGDYHLAEDVSQEAFIEAFRSMHTLRDPAAFPAWLKTIIGFRCNRILRKPSLRTDPLDDSVALADTASNPELLVVRRDETSLVWQAVRQLPEQDRVIVTLYYLQEYTHQQIASFLGIPASRVNNRLHASRKKLQKELLAMFGDEMAQMKPSRDDQFRRTVIEGVMPISHAQTNYSMLCHFGVSLLAAVSVLGCETDYPTIMGASGMAFRMVWIAGWHMEIDDVLQMADDPYEPIRRAFGALGYRYRIRHCTDPVDYPRYYPATHPLWVTRREAAQEIRHSIDHGIPVIAFGVTGSLLASLVTGYEDNGEVLLGLNADDGGENSDEVMPSGFFKKEDWYPHTAAYILIGEQTDLVPRRRRYLDAVR